MRNFVAMVSMAVMLATSATADDFPTIEHFPSVSQIENLESPLNAAEGLQARRITPLSMDMIKDFEKWVPRAYNDPSGYCTIGYGHLISLRRCENTDLKEFGHKTLTIEEGSSLLEADTRRARLAVQRLVKPEIDLSDDQFSSLSSFVFNVGEENFSNSTMLILLNDGNSDRVGRQFGRWVKSKGVVLSGLQTRRACERTMFDEDLAYGNDGKFHRSDCGSLNAADVAGEPIDIEQGE